jgi:hypothetical protein
LTFSLKITILCAQRLNITAMKIYRIIIVFISLILLNLSTSGQIIRNKNTGADNSNSQSSPEILSGQSLNDDSFTASGAEYKYDYGKETGLYLDEKWLPGEIVLSDGTIIKDRLLRYNIYSRQIEFVDKNDTMAIANTFDVKQLKIGERSFIFTSFVYDGKPVEDWLEVLVDGDYSLFLYRRIVYRYVESLSESNPETDRFFMIEKYYIQDSNGEIKALPNTKKQIVKCLAEKNPDIESFMKENKIRLTKEGDLVKLMEFCNKKDK